jgi:hypothetical protein
VGDSLVITPHAAVTLRHQAPGTAAGSYLEEGGGVSVRIFPGESASPLGSLGYELLLGCHKGTFLFQTGMPGFQGCRATAVMRF